MKDENEENINIEETSTDIIVEETSESVENTNNTVTSENGLIEKNEKEKKRSGSKFKILIVLGAILLVLIIVLVGFAIINKFNTNVYNNIYLNGKAVSGMSVEQLQKEVVSIYQEHLADVKIDVFQGDKLLDIVEPGDIELSVDIDETVNQILNYGRSGNLFTDNIDIISLFFNKKEFDFVYSYDEEKLNVVNESIANAIENKVVNDGFEVDDKEHKLIIIRGHKGYDIDNQAFKEDIVKLLKLGESVAYNIKLNEIEPKELNLDEVHSKVFREAKDAYVAQAAGQKPVFNAEIYGHDFDISELKAVLDKQENKEEDKKITFDLKVTEPKVKYKDIAWSAYENKLGSRTTYFPANNYNRATNVRISAGYINGIVIMPGETFSFNKAVGDITASKGYKSAATFKNGTVVNEIGGGVCQVVSTLYNAVLYANLQIVTRYQHALPVGYVAPSLDATMYYPSVDFKFKNNRNYPIKIVTSYSSNGSLNVSIYGTNEDVEYEIVLSSKYLSTISYTTKYIDDPSLPAGTTKVKTDGVNGYKSESYKITKLNGKVIKTELLSRDTYKAITKIVLRGTGGKSTTTNTTPTETPSSSDTPSEGNSDTTSGT